MSHDFAGKVALVTGGGRGLGRAICLALAQHGARVAINFQRSESEARETLDAVRAVGSDGVTLRADVSIGAEVTEMVEQIHQHLGPIDFLVNNAGIYNMVTHEQLT